MWLFFSPVLCSIFSGLFLLGEGSKEVVLNGVISRNCFFPFSPFFFLISSPPRSHPLPYHPLRPLLFLLLTTLIEI
jgi:hypothetical protein